MKTNVPRRRRTEGNMLLVSLVSAGLVGLVLLAYLNLVRTQNTSTMRSQAWNAAIPIIESGIEEALVHLNKHAGSTLACDGWLPSGTTYCLQRTIGDGFYVVTITNYFPGISTSYPVIESRGYVSLPQQFTSASPGPLMATVTAPDPSRNYLGRGVRVTTRNVGLFTKAMVAKGQISLSGRAATDSFDSSDPAWSTNGQYDPSKTRDRGDIATNGQLVKEINASGNVKIRGHVSTGPGGTVGFNGGAAIGSQSWVDSGKTGVEPGWFADDMNVNFQDVQDPFGGGYFFPTGGKHDGTTFTYLLGNGNYKMSNLNLSGQNAMMVTGDAVLFVPGNVSLSGQAYIAIAPGGSLKIYVGGAASLSGQGVANMTGSAEKFIFYGLPTCKRLALSGNSAFVGAIYAPNAAFNMSGGSANAVDFTGASITSAVNMSGNYNFHYDEALGKVGPPSGFVVTSWNEMSPKEVGTTLITAQTPAQP